MKQKNRQKENQKIMHQTKSGEIIEQQRNREQQRTIEKQKNRRVEKQTKRKPKNNESNKTCGPGPRAPSWGPGGRREGGEGLFTMMIMLT